MTATYNHINKSIELNLTLKIKNNSQRLDYDFLSHEFEVMIFLKMGKYYLNHHLCNKKNYPYILIP